MRPKLSLKTLYRSPVRTVLTFILLVAVTFSFVSQVLEYSVAKREMEKMVALYDGVLNVSQKTFSSGERDNPGYIYADERVEQGMLPDEIYHEYTALGYAPMTGKDIEQISSLPYVSYINTRYTTAAVSDFPRMDEGLKYYDYTNICVIEADVKFFNETSKMLVVSNPTLVGGEPIANSSFGEADIYIAGEPSFVIQDNSTIFYWRVNGRAVSAATTDSVYTREYLQSLNVGERYVFVLRYEDELPNHPDTFTYYLTDPFIYGQCEAIYPLKGELENYLETEKFAPLKEYINIIETDQYTLDAVYTKNMNAIRHFADKTIGITEGRALTAEDTENGNNVCVISHTLAKEYELKVGDKITVDLGNKLFSYNKAVGSVSAVKGRQSTEYTKTELEIVGIYKDTRNKYSNLGATEDAWSYTINTIFVPQHLLNVDKAELENQKYHYGEVSFVVEDAWNTPAFKEEVVPVLKEMGYTVYFENGNFEDFIPDILEIERIAFIKIGVLVLAVLVVTWFVCMLYVTGRKRDYAIMRLLGTTKAKSAGTLLLPLLVVAIAAVALGSVAAYIYTTQNIADSQYLKALGDFEADTTVSVSGIIICVIGEIVLTLILAMTFIGNMGRKSPLALMQANTQKRRRQRKKKNCAPEPSEPVVLGEWESIERLIPDGKKRTGEFIFRYVIRHIRRTTGKALLFILIAIVLINLLGQLLIMKKSYEEVFVNTKVVSNFAGCLNLEYIESLQESEYVTDVYYRQRTLLDIDRVAATGLPATISNDIYLYAAEQNISGMEITWLDGYDETSTHKLGNIVIMGEMLMEERGWKLGDTIEIADYGYYGSVVYDAVFIFRRETLNGSQYTEEEIIEIKKDEINDRYIKHSDEMVIVGCATADNGAFDKLIFMPGSPSLEFGYGALFIPPSVSAVLVDNYKAEEYREFALELSDNGTGEVAFIMDTSKIENVRNNIELMNTLYPIMIAAVMIIGAFLCGMLIVQNSKDIAIMRVLGTSKRRVRSIMVVEHMILCVIGVMAASAVLAARGVLTDMLWVAILYVVVVFFASLIASSMASRKNVLELLQTKE
ncbi:MAG: ABC transporter permease [Oscillospiraceae bacterium]|nr:ABC transporter permease [Oscillospiraceae bacterium]